jgi:hypothetical protein
MESEAGWRPTPKEEIQMKTINELRAAIENEKARSAWDKAVKAYALELIEDMDGNQEFYGSPADKKELLNGADSWHQYSWGGCSLIYDGDIAQRVCSPSELKKTKNGENRPNAREEWLDVQARALSQAERLIVRLAKH